MKNSIMLISLSAVSWHFEAMSVTMLSKDFLLRATKYKYIGKKQTKSLNNNKTTTNGFGDVSSFLYQVPGRILLIYVQIWFRKVPYRKKIYKYYN